MSSILDPLAFPRLDAGEMQAIADLGMNQDLKDGELAFKAGDADIDLCVVRTGRLDILNPGDGNSLIVSHDAGEFAGDIDLLTRRPVVVSGVARGDTRIFRLSGPQLRKLLNTVPRVADKLLIAFQRRRELLQGAGVLGLIVVGPAHCRATTDVREFLFKNFVPFTWFDSATMGGKRMLASLGSPAVLPAVECSDGRILSNPSLRELADCAGIWRECPKDEFDLAIVGAGPAGLAAAVYAASEGLKTIVLDKYGPGGQAGSSSKIENFIGFPAGLSGNDLATRGVLQMLKFGAVMAAPVKVERLEASTSEDNPHQLHLDCGSTIRARTVLVATGVAWRRLDVPGAKKFERAGLYHACTAVESRLHDGEDVAVVGAGNSAGQAAMYLAEQCAKTVHLLVRRDELGSTMSDYLVERIRAAKNIVLHTGVEVTEVVGVDAIREVVIRAKADDELTHLPCTAIFVFIGAEPHAKWLPENVARDEHGYLMTGADAMESGLWPCTERQPCPLETTIPRLLAAGDVRAGSTKRVGFAVGDGSLAVSCAHTFQIRHP